VVGENFNDLVMGQDSLLMQYQFSVLAQVTLLRGSVCW